MFVKKTPVESQSMKQAEKSHVIVVPSWKKELNAKVLDIEFLLISVVQGMALTSLAADAVGPITNLSYEFWPYIISAFVFILIFWSQAIIHALSFIDWPLDLGHSFLYFLASFVEVMAFSQIEHPEKWYIFTSAFLVVGVILYIYDLLLMKRHEKELVRSTEGGRLYQEMYSQQKKELVFLLPSALGCNLLFAWLLYQNPGGFIQQHNHIWLSAVQALFGVGLLFVSIRSFKERVKRITAYSQQG